MAAVPSANQQAIQRVHGGVLHLLQLAPLLSLSEKDAEAREEKQGRLGSRRDPAMPLTSMTV